jgi:hypothetical protein
MSFKLLNKKEKTINVFFEAYAKQICQVLENVNPIRFRKLRNLFHTLIYFTTLKND